ncbi:MAG: hypothetical protein QG610_1992 [Euryarchaeota archaeon]|nr:hypothetical protein [Euryarchaeota archaeon]
MNCYNAFAGEMAREQVKRIRNRKGDIQISATIYLVPWCGMIGPFQQEFYNYSISGCNTDIRKNPKNKKQFIKEKDDSF